MTDKTKEIDYSVVNAGPLYISPSIKKPGFVYQFVSNKPGEIEMYQRWGYEVVQDETIKVGQDKPNTSTPFGAAVTVQSKCGQLLVLMAITEELHQKLMTYRAEQVKKTEASIGVVDGIDPNSRIGSFNREFKRS